MSTNNGTPSESELHKRSSHDAIPPSSAPLPLASLFEVTRLHRPFTIWHFIMWAYMPLGVLLLVVKLIWVAVWELVLFRLGALLHMNDLFFRVYICPAVVIKVTGKENLKAPGAKIVVSNHVSEMDSIAVRAAIGGCHAISPSYYKHFIFTRSMVSEMHPIYIDTTDRESLHKNISETLKTSKLPIMCFPEGCVTNGTALMKYHKFLFSLGEGVIPIATHITRPFPVHMDTLCAPTWHNILWVCTVPWQVWHINVLPAQYPREGETAEEFASRVQSLTAQALGIPTTPYLKTDKYKLVKERSHELKRRYRIKQLIYRSLSNMMVGRLPWATPKEFRTTSE